MNVDIHNPEVINPNLIPGHSTSPPPPPPVYGNDSAARGPQFDLILTWSSFATILQIISRHFAGIGNIVRLSFDCNRTNVRCARLSNTRSHFATAWPSKVSTVLIWLDCYVSTPFIACNLKFFMMASVKKSIHQGHEGFSELFRGRQCKVPAFAHCIWHGLRALHFCVLAHDHNAMRWDKF